MNVSSKKLKLVGLAAILATALPAAAWGAPQRQIDDSRPVSPDMTLEVDEIVVGHIRVLGWDQNEMSVTGTIGQDVDEFIIEGGPDYVEISADWNDWDDDDSDDGNRRRWRGRDHDDVDIDLEIRVPRGASLEIAGVTANITVTGVDGEIDLETVTGTIEYSGNAAVIDIANVTGPIHVASDSVGEGDFESVQGNITFTGNVRPGGEMSFETVGGSVTLELPAAVSAEFDIETMMGDIDNDFGPAPRSTNRWVPSKELSFRTGNGDGDIYIETLQGTITLRQQ